MIRSLSSLFKSLMGLLLVLFMFSSCGNLKYLKVESTEGEPHKRKFVDHWVHKNKIKYAKQAYDLGEDAENIDYELQSTILQQPDKSPLKGFRKFIYHTTDSVSVRYVFDKQANEYVADTVRRQQRAVKLWLHNSLGSPPTIYDSTLTQRTQKSMLSLLHQRAFFDAQVTYDIQFKRHKTFITYHIVTGKPLLIDSLQYYSKDTVLQEIIRSIQPSTLLKKDAILTAELVAAEKQRITLAVRNQGYFDFTWKYIVAQADTVNARKVDPVKGGLFAANQQGEPRANVYMEILPYSDTSIMHPKYKICNVYITPNEFILKPHQQRKIYKDSFFIIERITSEKVKTIRLFKGASLLPTDTIVKTIPHKQYTTYVVKRNIKRFKRVTLRDLNEMQPNDRWVHTVLRKKYTQEKDFFIRDRILSEALAVESGDYYNYNATQQSVKNINNLAVFRFPRIEYVPSETGGSTCLDCIVKMQPGKKQNLGADFEVNFNSTTANSVGFAVNPSYRNRNLFKGAETLEFNLFAGVDFKIDKDTTTATDESSLFEQRINLIDINGDVSMYFPRFLGINALERAFEMENTVTKASIGGRYLKQSTDFSISSIYAKFGYLWNHGRKHQFSWNPILVSLTFKPVLDPSFRQLLADNNVVLLNSLEQEYLLPSMDFSHSYTSDLTKSGLWKVKTFLEVSGNLLNLVDLAINPNEKLKIGGINYSQYFRAEVDARHSFQINRKTSLVSRINVGILVPYGNSEAESVPFIKRFTLGGPTSMRAWNLRYLGPGDQADIPGAEFQMGDIKLEFNTEYRFMFNSWIGGAFFTDIGNVWLFKGNRTSRGLPYDNPNDGAFTTEFYKELAVAGGFGVRFDFSFFVFRLDLALQLREPQGYLLRDNGTTQYWNFEPFVFTNRHRFVLAIGYPF